MNNEIKLNGKVKKYMRRPIILVIPMIIANIWAYYYNTTSGIIVSGFILVYVAIAVGTYHHSKAVLLEEMVDFATQYSSVQRDLLNYLDVPYALLDASGKVLWGNNNFQEFTEKGRDYHKSISGIFQALTKEKLEKSEDEAEFIFEWNEKDIHAITKKIYFEIEEEKNDKDDSYLISLFIYDQTEIHNYMRENEDQKLEVALAYIDNYDEVLDSVEDVRKSLLVALIDRKVNQYFAKVDGLVRKTNNDKYFIVYKKKYAKKLEEDMFSILEEVKGIKAGNEMAATLSIGIGEGGETYEETYQFARTSIDFALARGGDQVVIKDRDNTSYYGGKSQKVEKQTRVKARVKAHALRETMESKDNVLIMGHNLSDVDSFGAAIGVYVAAKSLGKRTQIVINDVTTSLKPMKAIFTPENGYPEDMFVNSVQAMEAVNRNTLVMVVDTNKPSYTECPELLQRKLAVVVFDHHRQGSEVIQNPVLSYIEPYASSACEMVAEVLQYFSDSIKLKVHEADCIYSGILIDTNNFSTKTGVRTFEAAAYLRRCGADLDRVRKLLRNDMASYQAKADVVRNAEVYRGEYAISECKANVESPTIVAAQAANELLNIIGIRASFVLTEYEGRIFISSRSIDEVNVQLVMEKLGGGGHLNIAGTQLRECTMEEAKERLKATLDKMIEEGAIDLK